MDEDIRALVEDLRSDRRVLRVKTRLVKILERLPDRESRRRVIAAVSVLLGYAVTFVPGGNVARAFEIPSKALAEHFAERRR